MKVYCKDCVFFRNRIYWTEKDLCLNKYTKQDTPKEEKYIYAECNERNEKNDCKDYKVSYDWLIWPILTIVSIVAIGIYIYLTN